MLPAWLASMMQVPAPVKETTPAVMAQTPVELEASIVNVTGVRPEEAVAVGV